MFSVLLGIHILVCIALVLAILLQSGKGGGLAGTFGGSGSDTVFGGRGAATFLSKATTVLGTSFMVTSLVLALLASRGPAAQKSLIREQAGRRATQSTQQSPGTEQPAQQSLPQGSPEGSQTPSQPGD